MAEGVNLLNVGLSLQGFKDLFMSLPEDLRVEFKRAVKQKMSLAHAWMMLIVAKRMLDEGMKDVHFHHELQLSGEKIAVDVYGCGGGRHYYAECMTAPEENSIHERAIAIKDHDPMAEFILVVQDRIGWAITDMMCDVDHIWVACKDGRALNLNDWISMRLETLNMAIGGFTNFRQIIDELDELFKHAGRSEAAAKTYGWNALLQIRGSLSILLDKIVTFEEMDVNFSVNTAILRKMEELKEEALRRITAAASEILSLVWPLRLAHENGKLRVEGDMPEGFYWHNWPTDNMQPAQEKLLKDLKRITATESKILISMIMPDFTGEALHNIMPKIATPLQQEIKQLILYLTNKMEKELEKMMEITK